MITKSIKMKTSIFLLGSLLGTGITIGLPSTAMAGIPTGVVANSQAAPSLAPMLHKVMPGVVNILSQGRYNPDNDPFAEPDDSKGRGRQSGKKFEAVGSGVVIDAQKGYILTNAHLTNQASTLTVTLNDGRRFRAKLIGQDTASDMAVLQITAKNLTPIPFADSNKVEVGDFVVAIGNPYGLNQTVTSGIVSALERNDLGIEGYEDFIQTDASINPGNSGGALVDLNGNLVGINTAILAPTGGNIGIGFAIPSNMAKIIMDQLIKYGSVSRGIAGIMMQSVTPELANAFGEPDAKGALVTQVTPGSPAGASGIQVGDIIEEVNGEPVENSGQVRNNIGLLRAGSTIQMKLLRKNKTLSAQFVTADPQAYEKANRGTEPFLFGMLMRNFDAQVPNFGHVEGVQVLHLDDNCPAWQAGLRPGDVIITVNGQAISNLESLNKLVADHPDQLLMNVFRGNAAAFFVVKK